MTKNTRSGRKATVSQTDLKGSHRFTVRYDGDIVRDAVRSFVWRRAVVEQMMMWIVSALMAVCSIGFLIWGDTGWLAGVMLVLSLLPLVFVVVVWRGQQKISAMRYGKMADAKADVTINTSGIETVSDLGNGKISWPSVTEVWERPRAFMIFGGDGQFHTLPSETMPQPVQAYLRTRPKLENVPDAALGPASTPPQA